MLSSFILHFEICILQFAFLRTSLNLEPLNASSLKQPNHNRLLHMEPIFGLVKSD